MQISFKNEKGRTMEEMTRTVAAVATYTPPRRRVVPEFSPDVPIAKSVPIAPTLKALRVGEIAEFPTEQRTSVLATIYRLRKDYKRQGWDVEVLADQDDGKKYVVRIKRVS